MRQIHPLPLVIQTPNQHPQTSFAGKELKAERDQSETVDKVQKRAEIRRRAALPCYIKQSLIRAGAPPAWSGI